ncbi:helix-turn-helix domain-containing protein [Glutamicibacter sp. M10]|uniref:helix-turn-helix domain-containing protein n=1 Tax=Glutamicibacter sp. M10 TaxID=3023076 RepID=UPI0021C6B428|nr:helix-turn-helix domain-containing protein [Glutamicibacter sp. M10]UXN30695.1 helix-turn-helix domain-containing protein [Glutamicibacter sp. M10]
MTTGPYSLMLIEEAAEFLRTPVNTMRFWRHKGIGPKSARVGGRIMFRRADLEAWLNEQFEEATK